MDEERLGKGLPPDGSPSVIIDFPDVRTARLGALAEELKASFGAQIEREPFIFYLSISSEPRLWIDPVCHVAISADQRGWVFRKESIHEARELYATGNRLKMAAFCDAYIRERLRLGEQSRNGT